MAKSVEIRELAVKYRNAGHTLKETSEVFNVSPCSVSKWGKKFKETGNLNNKPLNRPAKKIEKQKLLKYIEDHPDAMLQEIADEFNSSAEAVRKALKRYNITRKK